MAEQNLRKQVSIVFVHGWAMNSAVWSACQALLPDWIDAIFVDLPGHGSMAEVSADGLDDYVQALMPLAHRPVIWVGWSLGALAVMQLAAHYPERVAALFLTAATPCFVKRDNWPAAVDETVFLQFAESLEQNQQKTLQRFLSLQVKGAPDARQTVRQLQQMMGERGAASAQALKNGLAVLLESDQRALLAALACPVSWYLGDRDTLVPVAVGEHLQQLYPQHTITVAPGAGHAPFVSHPQQFVAALVQQASQFRRPTV